MSSEAGELGSKQEDGGTQSQRLDKWLWFVRVVKTRTLAATLVSSGKVRLNRLRVAKPSQTVRVGDVVTVAVHRNVRVLRVVALGERRGPASEASTLFEELAGIGTSRTAQPPSPSGSPPAGSAQEEPPPTDPAALRAASDDGSGRRPDKRQRRKLMDLKRGTN